LEPAFLFWTDRWPSTSTRAKPAMVLGRPEPQIRTSTEPAAALAEHRHESRVEGQFPLVQRSRQQCQRQALATTGEKLERFLQQFAARMFEQRAEQLSGARRTSRQALRQARGRWLRRGGHRSAGQGVDGPHTSLKQKPPFGRIIRNCKKQLVRRMGSCRRGLTGGAAQRELEEIVHGH
jgi:hypothetical protein